MKKLDKNKLLVILLIILAGGVLFEIAQHPFSLLLLLIGLIGLFARRKVKKDQYNLVLLISLFAIAVALMGTFSAWALLIILLVIVLSKNQDAFHSIKETLFETNYSWIGSEYVSIKLDKYVEKPVKRSRRPWFGSEADDNIIYEWDDINYTKIAGDTVIDLGNTIVPKDQNIILVRKAFGNTKILIPEEVAVSLDLSVFLGKVKIGEDELVLNNEVISYRSDRYDSTERKIKIASSTLFGDVEVVFL